MKLFAVIPTIRPAMWGRFIRKWTPLFKKWNVRVVKVSDGNFPTVQLDGEKEKTASGVMGPHGLCIYNKCDAVRNLGFALAYLNGAEAILSLDDDVEPIPGEDPINDHLRALSSNFPVSWLNTGEQLYMRGFPYGVRQEAECVLSHGVWTGMPDLDAPTQLLFGAGSEFFPPRLPVPKGAYFPCCAMNMAFKIKILPYIYQAPAVDGVQRFSDIFAGIAAKKEIDRRGWCAVTGFATVHHTRASDPFVNLEKEGKGIRLNESFWKGDCGDPYFKEYFKALELWREFLVKNKP